MVSKPRLGQPASSRSNWPMDSFFHHVIPVPVPASLTTRRCCPAVGRPWLIILGDRSDLAYGFTAYIRWCPRSELYWCRLIMAKCRIAHLNLKLQSTPRLMESNAAGLSKRGRKVIESEIRFDFEKVLQLVDSETVLSIINKTSTRLVPCPPPPLHPL